MTSSKYVLNLANINQKVIKAEYAVRGTMVIRANEIKQQLKEGVKFPFEDVTECNIGNPQIFGQQPFTFHRQVLSCTLNPGLLHTNVYHNDVFKRAGQYLDAIKGMGAYSDSAGFPIVRQGIKKYIEKRDNGIPTDINNIYTTDGATTGLYIAMEMLLNSKDDGIMVPFPQYPLYSALLTVKDANLVPYYLNEEKNWSVDIDKLQEVYNEYTKKGVKIKGMVIINPGNPTGNVLDESDIEQIVEFAHRNKVVLLADEVYQLNIYAKNKKFHSFKSICGRNPDKSPELFSFHSTSKGIMGECGIRGGYFEVFNISPEVKAQLDKLRTMFLCSNTTGQVLTDLMVNPPNREENAEEVVSQYEHEYSSNFNSLIYRAQITTETLRKMKNVTCNEVEGAMYAFPRIHLPDRAIAEAEKLNMAPDLFYTMQVMENTGIVTIPGSGFKQVPGTHHFRITTLILPEERLKRKLEDFKSFNDEFMVKYSS